MPLPTLYNTRTTVVDLSTAMFADSANTNPVSPAGVASSSSVSLYQSGDPINEDAMTYALIPSKIDFSNCDTIEFSFKYDNGGYAGANSYEGLELGFYLNADNFANFSPKDHQDTSDLLGIGGVLKVSYPFHTGNDCEWQFLSSMPPRTGYPNGLFFEGGGAYDLWDFNDSSVCLTAGAYNGSSTLTLRAQLHKALTQAGDTDEQVMYSLAPGQTIAAISTWIAENGVLWCEPVAGNPSLFRYRAATPDGSAAYDLLASPYLPLTVTPFVRRLTYRDVAGHPQTISNLSITVGSSTKPVFWTDLQGCAEG